MTLFDNLLAQARRPECTVRLCLRGDLVAQWQELTARLGDASTTPANLGERSPASVLAEQIRALEEQMRQAEVPFTLRALGPREWADFYSTRPIRGKDEDTKAFDDRWYTWACQMVATVCVDPVMTAEQVSEQLVPVLSTRQWDELSDAAWTINTGKVTVPFSEAASRLIPNTGPTSRRLDPSASVLADSSAPNPAASPSVSTTTPAG